MRRSTLIALSIVAGSGILLLNTGCGRAAAQPSAPSEALPALDLTVYKEDFAMIHERRTVDVKAGVNHLRLNEVSKTLDPSSVMFQPAAGLDVVSSTYDLGVASEANLLQRLAGKDVDLIWPSDNGHEGDTIHGRLEPSADGGYLIRTKDRIYVNPKGTIVAPTDEAVSTLPGLAVQVDSKSAGRDDLRLSYLTRGLSWSADYVAHLDPKAQTIDMECWAGVTNQTGIPFRDAKMTFVAGDPNRAVTTRFRSDRAGGRFEMAATPAPLSPASEAVPMMPPEAMGELYEYKASNSATIGIDQVSRVRMFEAASVPVKLDYSIRLPDLSPWGYPDPMHRTSAVLAIGFDNRKASQLGFPLPSGAVRVYERDGERDRYVGADTVMDLAADAHASLTLSKVFDVSAEPKVMSSKRLDKHTVRKTIHVTVYNAKTNPVLVRVVSGLPGIWKYVAGEHPERLDASTAQWKVKTPPSSHRSFDCTFDLRI